MPKAMTIVFADEALVDLRDRMERIFGADRLATKAARALKVSEATVHRWLSGASSIPGYGTVALDMLEACPRSKWPHYAREALSLRDSRKAGQS